MSSCRKLPTAERTCRSLAASFVETAPQVAQNEKICLAVRVAEGEKKGGQKSGLVHENKKNRQGNQTFFHISHQD